MSTSDVLESSGLRGGAYAAIGLLCVVAASREAARQHSVRWPSFWYLTAAALVALAAARAIGIDDVLIDLGRERARLDGWYRARRGLQAGLVGAVGATWMIVVFVSIWRVPERRRRYLPTALASFTVLCFAAVRLVSLHHVDTLLYRRSIAGVAVVVIGEWTLLALTVIAIVVSPSFRSRSVAEPRPQRGPLESSSSTDRVSTDGGPANRSGLMRLGTRDRGFEGSSAAVVAPARGSGLSYGSVSGTIPTMRSDPISTALVLIC